MLRLSQITKQYVTASETVDALKGVNIAFRRREFVSILGPSGCGKTTLLNIIGGLDHYTSGDLVISGRSTKGYTDRDWDVYRNHRIGFIFQSYNLIPHQTILGNVELALTIAGIDRAERIRRAKIALDRVGLAGQYDKRPNQLSGGQCQRVAIARALVNDPEILLADEPTGALDTVTSLQIMELIKEISGERLVIMVTHNPELAEKYSSRIIRLLDGQVQEDSMPFSEEEEEREVLADAAPKKPRQDDGASQEKPVGAAKPKKERAQMSFLTAFMLSARNLISKRGRTAMVGFAGSIGIIGIALVLAFSAGIKGYVASMQDDMLSGNPITVERSTYDLSALSDLMNASQKVELVKEPNRVYINSVIEYITAMDASMKNLVIQNALTREYIEYVKAMPRDFCSAQLLDYGMDMTAGIYTDFHKSADDPGDRLSINALTSIYIAMLSMTDFKEYAPYVTALVPSLRQMPDNPDYIASQYDLAAGRMATGEDEIMLVLDRNSELSDLLLARLGYYTGEEFRNLLKKATGEDETAVPRDSFSYEELMGKTLYWYPNDSTLPVKKTEVTLGNMTTEVTRREYRYDASQIPEEDSGVMPLHVVGILEAKENVAFGSLRTGIYYTAALTDRILSENRDSQIVRFFAEEAKDEEVAAGITYSFTYRFDGVNYDVQGSLGGSSFSVGSMGNLSAMMSRYASYSGFAGLIRNQRENLIAALGGNDLAQSVTIYPSTFDDKDRVTAYLDAWNDSEAPITVGDTEYEKADRGQVKYTDTLSLIINIINTMINVVSYSLIAFTSVSLVVSTVMIGIITYVSVVERIKEIGVIRALGGRKKDVRHLFNAETFIIGLLAGLMGILATYLISAIVNAILYPLTNIRSLAALPFGQAMLLVLLSVGLTLISGLIPASSAAKKDPVIAWRTE